MIIISVTVLLAFVLLALSECLAFFSISLVLSFVKKKILDLLQLFDQFNAFMYLMYISLNLTSLSNWWRKTQIAFFCKGFIITILQNVLILIILFFKWSMSKQLTVVFLSTNFNKDELNAVKMYFLLLANVLILTNDECILVSVLQMLYI